MQSTCRSAYDVFVQHTRVDKVCVVCNILSNFEKTPRYTLSLSDYLFVRHIMREFIAPMELTESAKLRILYSLSRLRFGNSDVTDIQEILECV